MTAPLFALLLALGTLPSPLGANPGDGSAAEPAAEPAVARLGAVTGDVDIRRADAAATVSAAANAPVNAGDELRAGADGRAEVELPFGVFVRVAPGTQVRFTRLDLETHTVLLEGGTLEVRVQGGLEAHPEIDTPSGTIHPDEAGRYRVTVTDAGATELTARSGSIDVITGSGSENLRPGSTLRIIGTGSGARFETVALVADDDFDRWADERDAQFAATGDAGTAFAAEGIVGAEQLDAYGSWGDAPGYGDVWIPDDQPEGWSPYHDGRFAWEPYYGWTWIGYEPWGWAPYHYGRWFYAPRHGWCWSPGRRSPLRQAYRPALVAFFSFGDFAADFGDIGWVPLAPFEPLHPWWHRTKIINSYTDFTVAYRNARAPRAAVFTSRSDFAAGDFERLAAASAARLEHVKTVEGLVPLVPTEENLTLRAGEPARVAGADANANAAVSGAFQRERAAVARVVTPSYALPHGEQPLLREPAPERFQAPPLQGVSPLTVSPHDPFGGAPLRTLPGYGAMTPEAPSHGASHAGGEPERGHPSGAPPRSH